MLKTIRLEIFIIFYMQVLSEDSLKVLILFYSKILG